MCAYTSNWNAGKCSPGQKAQIEVLKRDFPSINVLPNGGKNCYRIKIDGNGQHIIGMGPKSIITAVKSLDAKAEERGKIQLFVLKTIDIGSFSDSEGGGHQGTVLEELRVFCQTVLNKNFTHNGKEIEFLIIISGRTGKNYEVILNSEFKSSNLQVIYYE